jgi:hypothetical protein
MLEKLNLGAKKRGFISIFEDKTTPCFLEIDLALLGFQLNI